MNKYNPNIHHRRSIRLKGYDYSQAGAYFITICCENRMNRFGDITVGATLADAQNSDAKMVLNEYGQIAHTEWIKLTERFTNFELDVFQIMPNHMHGIIVLNNVGATLAVAQNDNAQNEIKHDDDIRAGASPAPTVSDIVGAYKSLVANGCLNIYKSKNEMMGKLWQRNYHEHIIRNEQSYQTISNYIINNPAKWNDDKFYMI
jgi:REP element-mobilizing transposase RayT